MVGVSDGAGEPDGSGVHEGVKVMVGGMGVSVGMKEIAVEAGNLKTTAAPQMMMITEIRTNQTVTFD